MRLPALITTLSLAAVLAGCAAGRPVGVDQYYMRDKAAAEEIYRGRLEHEPNSRALYLLLLGTVHMDEGRLEEARREFIEATRIMESFVAEGEFEALVGQESAKEYKGDPYERMMAWWYLGLLDYALGDYRMALPSFKSAVLADGGVRDERFMGDNASGYLMTGKTYQALGQYERASREFDDALRVGAVRRDALILFDAISSAATDVIAAGDDPEAVQLAADLTAAAVPEALQAERDTPAALTLAAETALTRLEDLESSEGGSRRLRGRDGAAVADDIRALRRLAARSLRRGADAGRGSGELAAVLDEAARGSTNLFVVAGIGRGPYKYNTGLYGQYAAIGRENYPERYAKVFVDGVEVGRTRTIEDVYYQAVTRGGRAMDAVLAGKAILKDVFAAAAAEAFEEADEKETCSDEYWDSMFTGMFSGFLAALVRAEADVRSWETLPDKLQALSARVEPGEHDIEVAFYGAWGEIPAMRMRWPGVRFEAQGETVVYVRAGSGGWVAPPGFQNLPVPVE